MTVQVSPAAKSAFGLIVKVVGPPETAAVVRVPLVAQTIWNQLPATFTGSLKVTVMLVFDATPVAPLAGVVAVTRRRRVGGEGEDVVGRHGVRRVDAVPSVTWAATTVTVQVSPAGEVGVGVEREGGRPAGDTGGVACR